MAGTPRWRRQVPYLIRTGTRGTRRGTRATAGTRAPRPRGWHVILGPRGRASRRRRRQGVPPACGLRAGNRNPRVLRSHGFTRTGRR
jgi:hypothetical protein